MGSDSKASMLWPGWLTAALVGCAGYALGPTAITSTAATLNARASCAADTTDNPCTGWFQYWRDGASAVLETEHAALNAANSSIDFHQMASGLEPSTLYHYQFCGFGDTDIAAPGLCAGPQTRGAGSVTAPGTLPDPGDLSASAGFRTAGPGTQGTYDLGRVLSTADSADTPISRDAGISVVYSTNPPRSLWLFGDTQQSHAGFIALGSAASGPFAALQAPEELQELPTPPAAIGAAPSAPAPFFPAPVGLVRQDGSPCDAPGSYAADWVIGGAKEPSSGTRVLLLYGELCIESDPMAFTLERVAFAEYDPDTNRFARVDRPLEAAVLSAGLAEPERLGSPVFGSDGYLYFFMADCQGAFCASKGAIEVARVSANADAWSDRANFRWWNGQDWTADSSLATSVIPGATPIGGGVSAADYSQFSSKSFVLIEQVGFGNAAFKVFRATSPVGPWTEAVAAQPPDACQGGGFGCYAVQGHPELSDDQQLVYSWFSVDDVDGYGHVRLASVAW